MVNNKEDIIILGYGGHAKSVADSILKAKKYNIMGYTDLHECDCHFKYLGTDDELRNLYKQGVHKAVLGIGYMGKSKVRDTLVSEAKEIGFEFPVIIDPSAIVASGATIGEGSFVGKKAIINVDSNIGDFCIINTGSIVEHKGVIGDYSHIAVGVILCGNVGIGHHSMIGAGTTVIQGQTIGDNCIIGANSTVLTNVRDSMKCYGIINNRKT